MARKEYDIALRAQALSLHATGASRAVIQEKTGFSSGGFGKLLTKAKSLGYVVGGPIVSEYVADQPKAGRREALTPAKKDLIIKIVTENNSSRPIATQKIADIVNEHKGEGEKDVSRRTVLRFLQRENDLLNPKHRQQYEASEEKDDEDKDDEEKDDGEKS